MAAGIMVPPLNDSDGQFGWSLGTIGIVIASYYLFGVIYAPITGWLGDRYGVRRIMAIGALFFIAGMVLTGSMTHLWQFYLYFGVLLAAGMAAFQVTLVSGVTLWFRQQLGLALSVIGVIQQP